MTVQNELAQTGNKHQTNVERTSERELVITRTFNASPSIVFQAWTQPELLKRWWVPKSIDMTMLSCEADVRVGGAYRFVFAMAGLPEPMAFHGKYLEVIPNTRLVWTNEEGGEASITTVTFEEKGGKTLLVIHEVHPNKDALEQGLAAGEGMRETFAQLDELITTLVA